MMELSKSQAILAYTLFKGGADMGHIKTAKVMLEADKQSINSNGASLTGYQYHKNEYGPYSYQFEDDRKTLEKMGLIKLVEQKEKHPRHIYNIQKLENFPFADYLEPEELKSLDIAIERIRPLSSSEASQQSHDQVYDLYNHLDKMPDYAFLRPYQPSEQEIQEAINDKATGEKLQVILDNLAVEEG